MNIRKNEREIERKVMNLLDISLIEKRQFIMLVCEWEIGSLFQLVAS